MDSSDLLEQEEAFHKLNAEIELRTRQLMKNVEAVMNKHCNSKNWPPEVLETKSGCNLRSKNLDQNNLMDNRPSYDYLELDNLSNYENNRSQKSPISLGTRKTSITGKSRNNRKEINDNGLIPQCAKGMSAEGLSRFLKAKGKLLQEELEHVRRELQIKIDECKKSQQELRSRDDEKTKITSEMTALREKVKKLETNTTTLTEKLHMRDSENTLLKKEIEMLKQDVKKLNLGSSNHEAKLNKIKEENERLKFQLKQSELNEKEARDKFKMKNEEMLTTVRKLEKQKSDLITAIKKQITLIENLKKQKGLLEAEGCLNFTEKEFLRLLEGKFGEERR